MKCRICTDQNISYWELLKLAPLPYQWSPPAISCPKCQVKLGASNWSRSLFILGLSVSLIVGQILLTPVVNNFVEALDISSYSVSILVMATFYIAIWPSIIRLQEWKPYKKPWLPKSRVVGYTVYLVIPASLIIGGLFLAVYLHSSANGT